LCAKGTLLQVQSARSLIGQLMTLADKILIEDSDLGAAATAVGRRRVRD